MPWAALILAGGQSQRMGQDKASLPWGSGTLLEHEIRLLRRLTDEVIIVAKQPRAIGVAGLTQVRDVLPGAHALGGLYTGLRTARADRCFVCACDMPFLNPRLIQALLARCEDVDLVIPETRQGLHPLHAVYDKSALPVIEAHLRQQAWTLRALVPRLRTLRIREPELRQYDPEGLSLFNLNTPEEYARALTKWAANAHRRPRRAVRGRVVRPS